MEDSVKRVEASPASALPAFPVHHNAAYNQLPVKPGVNGSAIAAFVLGLCGVVVLAVIFGIRALTQIGDSPQKGKAWAIAGLCLCLLWLIVLVLQLAR